jgi:hypothetical protein
MRGCVKTGIWTSTPMEAAGSSSDVRRVSKLAKKADDARVVGGHVL